MCEEDLAQKENYVSHGVINFKNEMGNNKLF